ncbi:MAG: ATP-binding protein, partial [Fusobacterium varium]|nr:ATP-binding protein [Fusobacterium varium]
MKLNLKKFMLELKESNKVECKLAKNNFPKEALNTYSAFANTEGGVLFLGIEEKENEFILVGVDNSDKIKKDMFDTLNNPQVVSKNLLNDSMVSVEKINEKEIIIIEIPSA